MVGDGIILAAAGLFGGRLSAAIVMTLPLVAPVGEVPPDWNGGRGKANDSEEENGRTDIGVRSPSVSVNPVWWMSRYCAYNVLLLLWMLYAALDNLRASAGLLMYGRWALSNDTRIARSGVVRNTPGMSESPPGSSDVGGRGCVSKLISDRGV